MLQVIHLLNSIFKRIQDIFYLNFRRNQPNSAKIYIKILGDFTRINWVNSIQWHNKLNEEEYYPY